MHRTWKAGRQDGGELRLVVDGGHPDGGEAVGQRRAQLLLAKVAACTRAMLGLEYAVPAFQRRQVGGSRVAGARRGEAVGQRWTELLLTKVAACTRRARK